MAEKEYIDKKPIIHDLVAMKIEYDAIALNGIIKALQDVPAADVVPRAAYEQMKWERDVAMQQLNDAGIPFCGETDGKRDEFFDRHLGKPVGECMCREERVIQNGRDESKEETQ